MKRFPIKVILLSLFIVINLTVICTFPTSMSDNDSEEVVNNLVTFLNKNDITVSPTIIDKETKKVSSATLQNFIEDRDAFAKNILGAKKEVTKNSVKEFGGRQYFSGTCTRFYINCKNFFNGLRRRRAEAFCRHFNQFHDARE